jgi:sugar lactone lactonase YvrE
MTARVAVALTFMALVLLVLLTGLPTAVKGPAVRELAKGLDFPEGPCCHDGKLYYTDYGKHQVWVWEKGKAPVAIWTSKGDERTGPSGIIPLGSNLLITCYDSNSLVVLNPKTGKVVETIVSSWRWFLSLGGRARTVWMFFGSFLCSPAEMLPSHLSRVASVRWSMSDFEGPNDLVKHSCEGIYFSASGGPEAFTPKGGPTGKVYYRTKEGKISLVAGGKTPIHYSNGLAIIDDGKTKALLVSEHLKNRILKFPILTGGKLGKREVWADLPTPPNPPFGVGADGLKTDSKGNVYAAHYGKILVLKSNAEGKGVVLRTIKIPKKWVSNLAFGPKEDVLYVTALDDPKKPGTGAVLEVPNR